MDYGDSVDLAVVVSNDGPDGASDVSVSLSDLSGLGLVVLDVSDDSFNSDNFEWFIGDLDNGESVSLIIKTRANRSDENIIIVSEADTSTFEMNKENNIDNDSLNILPVCDLEISIYPDNSDVHIGDTVNWIINVTNKGPDNASDVDVFNSLPEGLEFIFSQSNKGDLENSTNDDGTIDFIWRLGDLENDGTALLVISTRALDEGLIPNNASVNSSTFDLNESNNIDYAAINVSSEDSNESDGGPNGDDENNPNPDNENEDLEDDYYDYSPFSDDGFFEKGNDDSNNGFDGNDSKSDEDKMPIKDNVLKSKGNPPKSPIDISKRQTGNPLILIVLSAFALFNLPFRKK